MDSNIKDEEAILNNIPTFINIFVSTVGLIFYLVIFILLHFYYKNPSLIKKEIFTFIFLYSIKTIVQILLLSSVLSHIICYLIDIISFYLIIIFINKSLTSRKLSENSISFKLVHKNYLFLIFIICSFPLNKVFNLSEKFILFDSVINIISAFIIFRYIISKFQILLEYLKEKKVTSSKIPDIYLPYMKAHYYYTSFYKAYIFFFISFIAIICSFSFTIFYCLLKIELMFYAITILEKVAYFCLVIGCLFLFYCLYKKLLGIGKNEENEEEANISNFTVIDVDIQQEEKEENSSFSRKKKNKKNKINKDDDNNYIKIEGEEIKENEDGEETKENEKDKDKDNNKGMEETESLNK